MTAVTIATLVTPSWYLCIRGPAIEHLKYLIATGYVGEVLSTTPVVSGAGWGTIAQERTDAYLLDAVNGATMLPIPVGHTLSVVQRVPGEVTHLSSVLAIRRTTATAFDTRNSSPNSSPD